MINRPTALQAKEWKIAPAIPAEIAARLNRPHPIMAQLLYNRGITNPGEAQSFLEGRYLEKRDPFLLPDMDTAVARIIRAIEKDETIVVYGDFDADGVTATVLLTEALRGMGVDRVKAQPYIPDRVDEGYGLNMDALTRLKERNKADLVITVDCGIRSVAEVAHAQAIGLDMIVTDHHSLGRELPPAVAVINPKRPDSTYPDRMLAGVGIAYKVAQALRRQLPAGADFDETGLLDLVAIGTVADLAPLLHENRQLVIDGLKVLNQARRPGIRALAELARLKPGSFNAESIAFGIGPRINAAGRLAHAYTAARLLYAENSIDARRLAQQLNELNQQRQQITADLSAHAEQIVDEGAPILIAADDKFLSGVVGLVASRLAEKHYRPAIVIEQGDAESRGSCRSIAEFHITEALDSHAELLVRHGGHAQAAGFTIRNEFLPDFIERMTATAAAQLDSMQLRPTLEIDAEIGIDSVDMALLEQLQQLEPTGIGNPAPVFVSRGVNVASHRAVGRERAHLQLQLGGEDGRSPLLGAIAFRQGEWAHQLPASIDLVYSVGLNEWRGSRNLQLTVQDIRPAA